MYNNSDLGEELLSRGLATIQRHRPTETRSSRYEKLMMAEERAIKLQKGQYARHLTVPPVIADHTRNRRRRRRDDDDEEDGETGETGEETSKSTSEVRKLLPYLTRKKSINCVCEYVFSGSRVKVYLPEHSCLVSFIIAGVRTPRRPDRNRDTKDTKEDDNLFKFVSDYVTSKLTQRNVRITVRACDRGDNLIGQLFLGKLNLGLHLVQKGYGSVFSQSRGDGQDRDNEMIQELFGAQRQAKNKRIGIWKNWTPPERLVREEKSGDDDDDDDDDDDMTGAQPLKKGQEYINVKITEINDPGNFYIQIVGEDKLSLVEGKMGSFSEDVEDAPEGFEIEKNGVYAGKFSADNQWYRVRSEGRTARGTIRVLFLDYGNRSELKLDALRPLPEDLKALKPLARNCCLAGLKTPIAQDYKEESIYRFGDLCFNRQLLAKVEMLEKGGKLHLTLLESQSSDSINIQLLRDGVLRVEDRAHPGLNNQMLNTLRENESMAKKDNLGVWEWGDVSDSEGEDTKRYDGRVPRRKLN
jgi:staphylococcal nuclease domain-containing protein 1